MLTKLCLNCEQPFQAPSDKRKYCSRKCAAQVNSKAKRTKVTLDCPICGESFTAVPSEIASGYGKYCSRDCANESKRRPVERICPCGETFTTWPKNPQKWCSRECYEDRGLYHATCENCGEPFPAKPANERKYCSRKCYGEAQRNKVLRTCQTCGNEFYARAYSVEQGHGKYCSNACKDQQDQRQGPERTCLACGELFYTSPSLDRKHCSRECYYSTIERNTETCETCGKIFEASPAAKRRFCSRECWMQKIPRPDSRGAEYGHEFTEELKEFIRSRDERECQLCQAPESEQGPRLDVHHIDYDKSNNVPENLVALCHSCHSRTSRVNGREHWTNILTC